MSKVPQHIIEEAARMGIVPGVIIRDTTDTIGVVPHTSLWYTHSSCVAIRFRNQNEEIVGIRSVNGDWATVIAPAKEPAQWINGDPNEAASHRQISYIMRLLDTRHVRKVTAEKIIAMLSEEHEYGNGLEDLKAIQRPS